MRHGMPLAIPWLVLLAGLLPAQERIPLPAPDPGPDGGLPAPRPVPNVQVPPPPPGAVPPYVPPPPPPSPDGSSPGPYVPYPPQPPGPYPPPGPSPCFTPYAIDDPNFWFGMEALVWWTKNQPLSVPLVTTGPASQGASAGNLGMPGTTSLDGPLQYGAAGGFRAFGGGWFTPSHVIGMDASLFILAKQSAGFAVIDRSQAGNLVINEPVAGAPFSTQVSAPGVETGNVIVGATTHFGGGDLDLLGNLYRRHGLTINLLGGYRYLQLDETLSISANSNLFVTTTYYDNMGNVLVSAPPGSAVTVFDQFGTRNQFNGGQVGAQFQYFWRRLFVTGTAKLAIGSTHEVVTISGNTNVMPLNADPVPLTGGNYATLQVGRYSMNRFALSPEGQLNIGYQFTPCVRAQVGYTFLYLSSVARPGNQIDNTYDGQAHPVVPMASSSFWAQGLTLGFQLVF
jgi:hypothetical protein